MNIIEVVDKKKKKVYQGKEALELAQGTVFIVEKGSVSSIGSIVMSTGNSLHPFINLKEGSLWGNIINDYLFKRLEEGTEINLRVNL